MHVSDGIIGRGAHSVSAPCAPRGSQKPSAKLIRALRSRLSQGPDGNVYCTRKLFFCGGNVLACVASEAELVSPGSWLQQVPHRLLLPSFVWCHPRRETAAQNQMCRPSCQFLKKSFPQTRVLLSKWGSHSCRKKSVARHFRSPSRYRCRASVHLG